MISVDSSVIIQIVNFLLLIWVLNIILYRPIRNILIQRREKIQGIEQKIDACERDSKEKDDAFAQGIKSARAKGLQAKESLLQEAAESEKAMMDEINRRAQDDLILAQKKIEKDIDAVKASLSKEIDTFADIIGRKILGRTA
ncbi:MAG: ATP synthase F0 subunit B [Desulfobacterales bacterium]|jgi:F-type H+-transporting ATPase subunit b|nr:ATP synthase F0 subunit B [Desulfobacterales bacterium]